MRKLNLVIAGSLLLLFPWQSLSQSLPKTNYQASEAARKLIISMEGFFPYYYKDIAGYETLAYGHRVLKGENFPQPCLGECADSLLQKDISKVDKDFNRGLLAVGLPQNRYDALADFGFNLGAGAFKGSHLQSAVNNHYPNEVVAAWFLAFDHYKVKKNGKIIVKESQGLKKRRQAEANLWFR